MAHADYNKFPPIQLEQTFPFGKHKGKPVAEVVSEYPDYLIWLRQMRWAAGDEGDVGLSSQIHELLDEYLDGNNRLIGMGYKFRFPGGRQKVDVADAMTEDMRAEVEQSSAGWGDW